MTPTPRELAIKTLQKYGYSAKESDVVGYIDVQDPYTTRSGGGEVRTGFQTKSIHSMHIWQFLNDRA